MTLSGCRPAGSAGGAVGGPCGSAAAPPPSQLGSFLLGEAAPDAGQGGEFDGVADAVGADGAATADGPGDVGGDVVVGKNRSVGSPAQAAWAIQGPGAGMVS